jgi:hypothetical protein
MRGAIPPQGQFYLIFITHSPFYGVTATLVRRRRRRRRTRSFGVGLALLRHDEA